MSGGLEQHSFVFVDFEGSNRSKIKGNETERQQEGPKFSGAPKGTPKGSKTIYFDFVSPRRGSKNTSGGYC